MNKITVPFNPIFKPVHQCKKRYVVMKGSAGSGKSVDTAQLYILRLMRDKGRNLVCVRKSDITNRDSTFAELESAINRMGVGRAWRVTQSPLSFTCINGNKIIFRGVNDNKQREKLKSITFANGKLTDVWIEEATELVQQDFEIIDDRLRGELPDGLFYQIKLTFNPVSSSHWIKKVFFDIQDDNVLTHQSTYLTNRFCDEAYRQRMLRRKEVDPEGYRIYGLGEWGEKGEKAPDNDYALRPCFDAPKPNELTKFIKKLIQIRQNSDALCNGSYRNVVIQNHQLVFERCSEKERVIVAINAADYPYTANAGELNGTAADLLTGETVTMNGQLELKPYSVQYLKF